MEYGTGSNLSSDTTPLVVDMYEFHGWFGLAETTSGEDLGGMAKAIEDIQDMLGWFVPPQSVAEVRALGGGYFVWLNGLVNRPRELGGALDDLLEFLGKRLPGSWGLLYDRDDEWTHDPPANMFRVRVLARGAVATRDDTFLSPWKPMIEDG